MTKKEIKIKIKELENKIKDLYSYPIHIPEYQNLIDRANQLKFKYLEKINPVREQYYSEIYQLKQELQKSKKKELIISENLKNWFHNWQRGVDFGYKDPYIRWISPNEKYVIITSPGGTAGQGTAMGSGNYYYAQTNHYLVKVIEGATWLDHHVNSTLAEHTGRLTKEIMDNWMKLINEDKK
jgi:hypothetical protein